VNLPAPIMQAVTRQYWELKAPYSFDWQGVRYTAPTGWRTDGASIPRAFWRLGHPLDGQVLPAAIAHDVLYSTHLTSRESADQMFYWRMVANGVPTWRAWAYYRSVRGFGWVAWQQKPWSVDAAREKVRVEIGVDRPKPLPDVCMGGAVATIALLIVALALTGCARLTVQFPTGEKVSYTRVGDIKLNMAEKRGEDGVIDAKLSSESEAAALTEMAKTINRLAELAGTK